MTLYTGGGRHEDAILTAIYRGTPADHSFLATTNARWYDPSVRRWSSDWRAYAMTAKSAVRKPSPAEQKALDKKKVLTKHKADPVKDKSYPPKSLKQEAKKIADERAAKKAEEKATPKPAVPLENVEELVDCLPALVERYRELSADRAVVQAEMDELAPQILALLEATDQRAVYTDVWQVLQKQNTNRFISKEKLLAAGVDMDTIEEATIEKKSKPFIQVMARGDKEQQE